MIRALGRAALAATASGACAALLAPAVGAGAGGAAGTTGAGPLACPATFHVLHDDRVGRLKLPAGHYRIRVLDSSELTCKRAAVLFARFLQDFDGKLPRGWQVNVRLPGFEKPGGDKAFKVKKARRKSGSGGGRHPSGRHQECPTFRVLNNTRVGDVRFPRGTYQMTALGGLSCERSSKRFAAFLELTDGDLPKPWKLRGATGTFKRGATGKGFQVNFWHR